MYLAELASMGQTEEEARAGAVVAVGVFPFLATPRPGHGEREGQVKLIGRRAPDRLLAPHLGPAPATDRGADARPSVRSQRRGRGAHRPRPPTLPEP